MAIGTPEKTSASMLPSMRLNALPTEPTFDKTPPSLLQVVTVDKEGGSPCRRCLRDGSLGDTMILAPYDPFLGDSPYRQPGPIFVHVSPQCEPYKPDGSVPEQLHRRLLSMRAFDASHCMVDTEVVKGDQIVEVSNKMMENDAVTYIHVHYAKAGCFAVRIDRADD
ncbi:hypothetical protein QQS21_001383 [Conoideocrella luteorostrata]|uniref:DUF1203 domain-containing protein n=1 Tax=Conoideocrella luteorostrata TaxID=1105319 RepID=A0AAJ0CXC6_9HYPO|nr:hypothetical protein QQS21_001383 [Conoideocrella luteorostrata]